MRKVLLLAMCLVSLVAATACFPIDSAEPPQIPAAVVPEPPVIPPPSPLAFEMTTHIADTGRLYVTNPSDKMVLVTKHRNLPADFVPPDLVAPDVPFPFTANEPRRWIRAEAAQALELLFAEAKQQGHELFALSGYRSFARQEAIFNSLAGRVGEATANRTVARPGQSEHQTGWAMDITSRAVDFGLTERFAQTPEGQWVAANAHRFGFVIRYPKDKEAVTGYSFEPWHLRFVGQEFAEYLFSNGLTMDEFFQARYGYGLYR